MPRRGSAGSRRSSTPPRGARSEPLDALNLGLAALFVLAAALQYNDPDPVRWMIFYGAAAGACLTALRVRGGFVVSASVGLVALGWAAWLLPQVIPGFAARDLVRSMDAGTPAIELGRECLGLLIAAAWMAMLTAVAVRRARHGAPGRTR